MRGLDPRIPPLHKSLAKEMDGRVKPGHDESRERVPGAMRHSSCRFAEPGPYQAPAFVTVPVLRSIMPRRAARCIAPGTQSQTPLPACHRAGDLPGDVALRVAEIIEVGRGDLHVDGVAA